MVKDERSRRVDLRRRYPGHSDPMDSRPLMRIPFPAILSVALAVLTASTSAQETARELRAGRAGHAFDHLGDIGEQAEAAAASGATIIYGTGLGTAGYQGLPPENELLAQGLAVRDYNRKAKEKGIRLALGYLCATSIVKLEAFDKNWSREFREKFKSPPSAWRQMDRQGTALPSWYGGDYQPACMNHPDWQAYQMFMVRQQLETGHDGIFFDNPTVHPQGCYCEHCMAKFAAFLQQSGVTLPPEGPAKLEAMRKLAGDHPKEFLRFRGTIARDFLDAMRLFARTLKPDALITCNNSLNSRDSFFSQCRVYGYDIAEMSKVEDLVVVEDMSSQPRVTENGLMIEYGPCYKLLHAISHGKPLVAVTLAAGDYHTPPGLVRLAMAEAAAHNASYLSWPTWPENQRQRMTSSIRPQADLLHQSESLLNGTRPRADVVLFLPFRQWVEKDHCAAITLATALSQANLQYEVISEENFTLTPDGGHHPVFLIEAPDVLNADESVTVEKFRKEGGRVVTADKKDWLADVQQAVGDSSLTVRGPAGIRAVVREQPARTIVHLFNLNVERLSSFEDRVTPATDIKIAVKVPFAVVRSVRIRTADAGGTSGELKFSAQPLGDQTLLEVPVPRIEISAIILIEP